MGLIWYLSSQTIKGVPFPLFPHADKLIHFVEFGGLAFLWAKALSGRHLFWIWVLVIFYGGIDEWHQKFVEGRQSDFFDFVMDAFGGGVVCGLFYVWGATMCVSHK